MGILGTAIPRSRYVALLALALLVIGIAELAPTPGLSTGTFLGPSAAIFSSGRVVSMMSSVGYASLFALMTLESFSLPVPSEVVLPFAGYLVYIGVMNFGVALALSTVAALVGALADYYLALVLGGLFVEKFLRSFGMDHGTLETAERWFSEKGRWTVLVARFVPLLRSVISLPAGLFRMPLWSFVVYTVIGCLAWNAVLVYAGYAAGSLWETAVGGPLAFSANLVLAVLALGSGVYLVLYSLDRLSSRGRI